MTTLKQILARQLTRYDMDDDLDIAVSRLSEAQRAFRACNFAPFDVPVCSILVYLGDVTRKATHNAPAVPGVLVAHVEDNAFVLWFRPSDAYSDFPVTSFPTGA